MDKLIYAVWLLFWICWCVGCAVSDYKKDSKLDRLPRSKKIFFARYIAPSIVCIALVGFGIVFCVAKFVSWVA